MILNEVQRREIIFAIVEKYLLANPQTTINIYYRLNPQAYLPLKFKSSKPFLLLTNQLVTFNNAINNYFAPIKDDPIPQNAYINLSFRFSEISLIPEFNHEVLHYKDDFCRPINFFANSYLWYKKNNFQLSVSEQTLDVTETKDVIPTQSTGFVAYEIDYIQKAIRNEEVGSAGEQFIKEIEQERLRNSGHDNLADKVIKQLDGLGYDLLSFETDGRPRYIEVKTTTANFDSEFYITRNEVHFKDKFKDSYFLYRVYNFNMKSQEGDYKIISGEDLELMDLIPMVFSCNL